jgi:hypothetical protein
MEGRRGDGNEMGEIYREFRLQEAIQDKLSGQILVS